MLAEGGFEFGAGEVQLAGAEDEGFEGFIEECSAVGGTGFGAGGDAVPDAGQGLDETFGFERDERFLHGVGVDAQVSGDFADAGEGIAGLQFAGNDRLPRRIEHLLMDGRSAFQFDGE